MAGDSKVKRIASSKRAGLLLPVARTKRLLRQTLTKQRARVSSTASVYLSAVLEVITGDILQNAVPEATSDHRKRTTANHVKMVLHRYGVLRELMLAGRGVFPGTVMIPSHPRTC